KVGNTSIDIHYLALNEKGEWCFTGRGRLVYIHPTTGKPAPLSEEMRTKLVNG
ncbi:acyl-CoA thioester hydrolase, partial [Ornithinibacillus halophilus]